MSDYKNDRPLTLSRLRTQLDYDQVTGVFTWKVKPGRRAPIGLIAGLISKRGYRRIKIDSVRYSAARLAWFYAYGDWPTGCLDHINGVRGDDRLCNLRTATAAENATNRKGWSSTGIKGVHKNLDGTYRAKIGLNGRVIYLGRYKTIDEAAAVRKMAALRLHGAFASEARA